MGLSNMFATPKSPDEISFADLAAALDAQSCALVDVREPDEFASGHVQGAQNLPLSGFDPAELPRDRPVVLMCKAGGRSAQALARARAAGHADVRHFKGGVMGWTGAGGALV